MLGRDPFDLEAWYAENTLGSYLASGVEMAMWDLIGKATQQPLYKLLGGAVRKKIELAACMGIRPYEEAKAIARQYRRYGLHHAQDQGRPRCRRKISTWCAASATASAIG